MTPHRHTNAICYSGYRAGQNPADGLFPTQAQIREDLLLLHGNWRHVRLYDCSVHARRTLSVIRDLGLDMEVMLGAYLAAERNNSGCPWGGTYSEERLAANERANAEEVDRLIELAREFDGIVGSVAVGNEALVEWTDHLVPLERVIEYVRRARAAVRQPVTVCENYVPWQHALRDLVPEVDFLALHTYPVWEGKPVHEALDFTRANFQSVVQRYPGKPAVITEAGWATDSNGRGIRPENTSPALQAAYYEELMAWSRADDVRVYVFEAFDEPWKGSPDPHEPEKHWGLFTIDRRPKLALQGLYPERMARSPARS